MQKYCYRNIRHHIAYHIVQPNTEAYFKGEVQNFRPHLLVTKSALDVWRHFLPKTF